MSVYLLYRVLESHTGFRDSRQEYPHLVHRRRRSIPLRGSSAYTDIRELVQGLSRATHGRVQVMPGAGLCPNLPCSDGRLDGLPYPVPCLFDRNVFSLPLHRGSACGLPTKPWMAGRSLSTLLRSDPIGFVQVY